MWDNDIINLNEAMDRVLGHADMYERWLDTFFSEDTLTDLKDSFKNEDHDAAHKAVHKIKGTAGNLSITRLATMALNLDERIKCGSPFDAMQGDYESLLNEFTTASDMYIKNRDCVRNFNA